MPTPTELLVLFLIGLAGRVVWRYLERGLDRIEWRAFKVGSRLAAVTGRVLATQWPVVVWWAAVVTAAFLLGWFRHYSSGLILFCGYAGGSLLAWASHRGWIAKSLIYVVFGLVMIGISAVWGGYAAFTDRWLILPAVGSALIGSGFVLGGIQMLRSA